MNTPGYVIWLTGISGSGKTTLGTLIRKEMEKTHGHVEFLDGDQVRTFFGNDLGYTRPERMLNVKRIAFAAMLCARNGTHVIVANIAPYYDVRDFIREKIQNYIEIYLEASLDKVEQRDVKGQYAQYREGTLKNLIGVDDVYDVPRNPDMKVQTDAEPVEESFRKIMTCLKERRIC